MESYKRDLRDETWMIREGLGEIEREQALRNQCEYKRYQISNIPVLGTDATLRPEDLPKPPVIYEDDSDYNKLCKLGGRKDLLWWYPDFPLDPNHNSSIRGPSLHPAPVEWSMHPSSLLPTAHEQFRKNRKLPPTCYPEPEKTGRLDPMALPPATGAPKQYTWEPGLKGEPPNMNKLITNGYVKPYQIERMKKHYFESLFDRPKNEDEKLQIKMFEDQRIHNMKLRERALRFNQMTKGKPSWTPHERHEMRKQMFPNGPGKGIRAPPPLPDRMKIYKTQLHS